VTGTPTGSAAASATPTTSPTPTQTLTETPSISYSPTYSPTPSIFGEYANQIDQLASDWQNRLGFKATYQFTGPVEYLPQPVLDAMTQVITIAFGNIEAHAHASRGQIQISVAVDSSRLVVADNGVGAGTNPQGRGVDQITALASSFGGTCDYDVPSGGGTEIVWTIPVTAEGV
jgi:signal transduction histidine kinase